MRQSILLKSPAATKRRRLFRDRLLLTVYCLLLSLPLAACRRGGEPGTLVIAVEAAPSGFDPRFSTGNATSARIMQLIYDTLVVKNKEFEFAPSLAERVEESADHQTFTFRLRQGVYFHNGKPLTSADVKYTFESIKEPATKSPIRGTVAKIDSISAPDRQTVVFHASEQFDFIGSLPAIGIIPEGAGAEQAAAPVGSGPYKFISYNEGDAVHLEADADYWGGAPAIPRLRVKVVTDNSTRQAELMSGEVDLALNAQFDPETVRALQRRSDIQVVVSDGANIGYLGANATSASLLGDVKVRQAVAYAIDRDSIIHRLLREQARKADALLPPEHWAYSSAITAYDHDAQRAMRLLDEAGFPDPDGDGPQTRLRLSIITSTNQLSRNIAAILQDQLRQVGIELEMLSLESATMNDRLAKAQYDLFYRIGLGFNQSPDGFQLVYHSRYQSPPFNDAIAKLRDANDPAQMRPLFDALATVLARRDYCSSAEVNRLVEQAEALDPAAQAAEKKTLYLKISGLLTDRGGQNRMRYCNPQVDDWIVEAERAGERAAKVVLYGRIEKAVSEELPQIYLWYPANVLIARKRVGNIQLDPAGSWYFIARLTLEPKGDAAAR
jgi:peptide/nickel transport system substrate-binding protein